MRATLTAILVVGLLAGCDAAGSGGMGAVDRGTPDFGVELFQNTSDGTEFDVRQSETSALLPLGDEVLAAYGYAWLNGGPSNPSSFPWVDVAVSRGAERGARWTPELFCEDPNRPGSSSYFSTETVRFRRSRDQLFVLPVTNSPIFYSAARGEWLELTQVPATVDCDGAADEQHALYYQSCREFRQIRVTGQEFAGQASFTTTVEEYARDAMTAVDPTAGAKGALYLAVIPHVASEAPRLYSLDGEAALGSDVGAIALAETLPDCDGAALARLRAYEIVGRRHHLFVEAEGDASPPLFHVVGAPGEGFTCEQVGGGDGGGAFRALQLPRAGDTTSPMYLVFDHGGACARVLSSPLDAVAWKAVGSLASGLPTNRDSAVVWPDGRFGFLSGESVVGYYQGQLEPGGDCSDAAPPAVGGPDADGADVTAGLGTEGNRIVIRRTRQQIEVRVEHVGGGGPNPICGVQTVDHTGGTGCDSAPEPQESCTTVEGFDWSRNTAQTCYNVPLELRFADADGRFPGVDLPGLTSILETEDFLGNETQYIYHGDPFTVRWVPEPGWDEVVVRITAEGESEPFHAEDTEDDGEHTLPADVFASIPHFTYVNVELQRTRAIPFPFPVAEGSSAEVVQEPRYPYAQFRVEDRPQ